MTALAPTRRRNSQRGARRLPGIVVVGFGRLGGALALSLGARGHDVSVLARSDASRRAVVQHGAHLAGPTQLRRAGLCLFAVQDAQLRSAVRDVLPQLGARTALVHCAGALTLSAFGSSAARRVRGSFHPLCAVSAPRDALAGHAVALSASHPGLEAQLRALAAALELRPVRVPERHRALYHAGAVLAAGGLVALADAAISAFQRAGIDREEAQLALVPLMRSALARIEARGLAGGLTGPIARGDASTVARHLEALPQDLAALYALLSRRAVPLARLEPELRAALSGVL